MIKAKDNQSAVEVSKKKLIAREPTIIFDYEEAYVCAVAVTKNYARRYRINVFSCLFRARATCETNVLSANGSEIS